MVANSSKHIHEDPILINQLNCKNTLYLGALVYQDPNGDYKLALATTNQTIGWVQGIVWSFMNENYFYLKTTPGPLEYRSPLTKDFFINNEIDNSKIPGDFGDVLWLSETTPGGVQNSLPSNGILKMIVGYKTKTGFIYMPKYINCCDGNDVLIP